MTAAQFANEYNGNVCSLIECLWNSEEYFGISGNLLLGAGLDGLRRHFSDLDTDLRVSFFESGAPPMSLKVAKMSEPWRDRRGLLDFLRQIDLDDDDAGEIRKRFGSLRRALVDQHAMSDLAEATNARFREQVAELEDRLEKALAENDEWVDYFNACGDDDKDDGKGVTFATPKEEEKEENPSGQQAQATPPPPSGTNPVPSKTSLWFRRFLLVVRGVVRRPKLLV